MRVDMEEEDEGSSGFLLPLLVLGLCVYVMCKENIKNVIRNPASEVCTPLSFRGALKSTAIAANSLSTVKLNPRIGFVLGPLLLLCSAASFLTFQLPLLISYFTSSVSAPPAAVCLRPMGVPTSAQGMLKLLLHIILYPWHFSTTSLFFSVIAAPAVLFMLGTLLDQVFRNALRSLATLLLGIILTGVGLLWWIKDDYNPCVKGVETLIYALATLIFFLNPKVHPPPPGSAGSQLPFPVEVRWQVLAVTFGVWLSCNPWKDEYADAKLGVGIVVGAILTLTSWRTVQSFFLALVNNTLLFWGLVTLGEFPHLTIWSLSLCLF